MKVIAISGKAQHGKDTTAAIIKKELERNNNMRVMIVHYGDLVKHICKSFFGWDGEKDEKGRSLLQYVGTDVIREQKPDYWVDFVCEILQMFKAWDYVLIPDCRFPNEIDRLDDFGFDFCHLRIIRPNFNSPLTKEQQMHPSETALDGIEPDYWIVNDGTMQDLEDAVGSFLYSYDENLYQTSLFRKAEAVAPLRVLVDLDDTVEDLLPAWINAINSKYGTNVEPEQVKNWDVSEYFPSLSKAEVYAPLLTKGFWSDVKPKEGAVEYLKAMMIDGHEVYIVTSSYYERLAEKLDEVLFKHFYFIPWKNVIITTNKQMIDGDVLIDDGVHNLIGGKYEKILMDAPHNRGFNAEANDMTRVKTWDEAYRKVCEIARRKGNKRV